MRDASDQLPDSAFAFCGANVRPTVSELHDDYPLRVFPAPAPTESAEANRHTR